MSERNETIAAIATGLTPSGIGIVRISGPESFQVIGRIFRNKRNEAVSFDRPNRIHYGFIHVSRETPGESFPENVSRETFGESTERGASEAAGSRVLDEVLVMNMKGPNSYTGEDTVENDCHGGPLMMRRILQAVLENGARLAGPGEFTKRAFLNGRIDLAQAEAVIDIINAKNDRALKAGVSQLKGDISEAVRELRGAILGKTAYIEAALDDPEHYDLTGYGEELLPTLEKIREKLDRMIRSFRYGKLVKEGINTCILGKPNAGKSSLLNALLGEERAIVTEIPGTTRDVIRESVTIDNLTLNIMDTAGIRDTEDRVEKIGVEKAFQYASEADLILYVIDASEELDASDREILQFIRENDRKVVYLLNKSDLPAKVTPEDIAGAQDACREKIVGTETMQAPERNVSRETLCISAKEGAGIGKILETVRTMFEEGSIAYNDEIMISSERHLELLKNANTSVGNVIRSVRDGLPEDFYTIDLMDAYRELGMIIGEETEDDLADRIFADFCMGK